MTLPPLLFIDDLQKLMPHRDGEWIRRFLRANSILHKTPSGSVYTTSAMLESAFPDAMPALVQQWEDVATGKGPQRVDDFSDLDET